MQRTRKPWSAPTIMWFWLRSWSWSCSAAVSFRTISLYGSWAFFHGIFYLRSFFYHFNQYFHSKGQILVIEPAQGLVFWKDVGRWTWPGNLRICHYVIKDCPRHWLQRQSCQLITLVDRPLQVYHVDLILIQIAWNGKIAILVFSASVPTWHSLGRWRSRSTFPVDP